MPVPRSVLVDTSVTPWYHCISRCVRRAFLCGEGRGHRKQWIENRLKEIVDLFAIECAGYSLMDNHLHLLVRIDSPKAAAWSPAEVALRWCTLFPLRDTSGKPLPVTGDRVAQFASKQDWVEEVRTRLADLGWFMKCLKEPLARLANKEDECTGAFWEGRYKSIAILDEESLLATAAYIDLNPVAAGLAATPEESEYTSLKTRLEHCRANGTAECCETIFQPSRETQHRKRGAGCCRWTTIAQMGPTGRGCTKVVPFRVTCGLSMPAAE